MHRRFANSLLVIYNHEVDHTHLLLHNGDKGENEQDVLAAQQQLLEDEYLGNQGLPPTGGQGVDEVSPAGNTLEPEAIVLPVCQARTVCQLCLSM